MARDMRPGTAALQTGLPFMRKIRFIPKKDLV